MSAGESLYAYDYACESIYASAELGFRRWNKQQTAPEVLEYRRGLTRITSTETKEGLAMSIAYSPDVQPAEFKTCPCGRDFTRPSGQQPSIWRRRIYCDRECYRVHKHGVPVPSLIERKATVIENVEFLLSWGVAPIEIAARAVPNKPVALEALIKRMIRCGRADLANQLELDMKWERVAA